MNKVSKKKPQIFKIQKSITGETLFIKNKKGTYVGEVPYDPSFKERFNGKSTIYILGRVSDDGTLVIDKKVSERSW